MNNKEGVVVFLLLFSTVFTVSAAPKTGFTELTRDRSPGGTEYSSAKLELTEKNGQKSLAVIFHGTKDLHYYATAQGAPVPALKLTITPKATGLEFGDPVWPEYDYFNDEAKGKIEVFVGDFTVFFPIVSGLDPAVPVKTEVYIKGIACTSKLCLPPFQKTLTATLTMDGQAQTTSQAVKIETPAEPVPPPVQITADQQPLGKMLSGWTESLAGKETKAWSIWIYLVLAVLAGLSINIMPCVLPIIPLIIMRLVSQAKESPGKRVSLGAAFCFGIVLFFTAFAVISFVITKTTGTVVDLNSLYRHPPAVITLFILIIFFALVFLDVITIVLPGAVTNAQQSSGGGFAGSIGMGFFAGIMSTPCSGALLGAVLVWAQTQPPAVSIGAIILMGIGMALPYALLIAIPKLLDFIPKPGTWMEIFKKACGFLLLVIAVKFTLAALTKDRLIDVLLYGTIFAFCVWMWGQWVSFNTPVGKKWTVRLLALGIAVTTGLWLLPAAPPQKINWQAYDADLISGKLVDDQPILIKFTADWCTNCKVVNKQVYQQPDIAVLINDRGLVPIKADTTQATYPATNDFREIFGEAGNLPVTILLNPKDKQMIKIRGTFKPEKLKQALNQL